MNLKSKRIFAGILSAAILTSALPFTAYAANSSKSASDETDECKVGGSQPVTRDMLDDEQVISTLSEYYDYVADNADTKSERKEAQELSLKVESNDYAASILPDEFDNSTNANSIYFPEIRSQGGIGSCAAWSTTYYQYTYTINKARGVKTTSANTYSPNFAYNLINRGCDSGSTSLRLYELLKTQGAVTLVDVPIKSYSRDSSEYKNGSCYTSWFAENDIWKHSLDNRISSYKYFIAPSKETNDYTRNIPLVSEGTPVKNVDSEEISKVKAALSRGEVLSFASAVTSWYTATVSSDNFKGENIVYAVGNSYTNHQMTIVGYNDNIWLDINGNGKADEGEMGAFKIANSWGKGTWGYGIGKSNDGFIWVAYDALNTVSAVAGSNSSSALTPISNRGTVFHEVSSITAKTDKSSGIYLEYDLNSVNRSEVVVSVQAKDKNGNYVTTKSKDIYGSITDVNTPDFLVTPYSIPNIGQSYNSTYQRYNYSIGEYSFNGSIQADDGYMTYDLSNVVPGINSNNLGDYEWSVKIEDRNNNMFFVTVKDVKIVDKNTNKEYPMLDDKNFTLNADLKTVSIPTSDNVVTIYYKGYSNPYIHYQVGSGAWTAVPGEAMIKTSEVSGYTHKYKINLGSASYANVCFNDGNNSWDSNNGSNYKFTKGSYTFSNGTIKNYSNESSKLSAKVSVNGGNIVPLSQNITINASATGGTAPYQYKYTYSLYGSETVIKDYSSSTSASTKLSIPGAYSVKVTVKDAKGLTSDITTAVTVAGVYLDGIEADRTSVKANDVVNFSAKVTNEKKVPITYSYTVKDSSGNVQTLSVNSKNIASWKTSKEGKYTVTANLLFDGTVFASRSISYTVDKGSENSENTVTIYYKGYSTPYIHYRVGSGAWTTAPGAAMTATSEVSGYTHKYTISLGSSSNTTFCFNDGKGNWDSNNGSNYTITAKGTYTVANGSVSPYNGSHQDDSKAPLTIYYKGYSTPYIHYQVGNGSWTAAPGVAMTATNEASGYTHKYTIDLGTAGYANVCFNDGNNNWDSNNGSNYKFIRGTYTFSNGTITIKRDDVSVVAQYTNDSTINSDKIVLGDTINVKANAFGGSEDYTFAVYYKLSTDSKWITKQNYSKNTNVSIKPTTAAVYNICVKAKDADGSIAKKYFTVTVNPKLSNNSKISASSISLGETFKVTAKASGGIGNYTYAVYYKKTSDTKWTLKQNYNSNSTVSIKPQKATSYNVCVKVKDDNGTVVRKVFTVNVK